MWKEWPRKFGEAVKDHIIGIVITSLFAGALFVLAFLKENPEFFALIYLICLCICLYFIYFTFRGRQKEYETTIDDIKKELSNKNSVIGVFEEKQKNIDKIVKGHVDLVNSAITNSRIDYLDRDDTIQILCEGSGGIKPFYQIIFAMINKTPFHLKPIDGTIFIYNREVQLFSFSLGGDPSKEGFHIDAKPSIFHDGTFKVRFTLNDKLQNVIQDVINNKSMSHHLIINGHIRFEIEEGYIDNPLEKIKEFEFCNLKFYFSKETKDKLQRGLENYVGGITNGNSPKIFVDETQDK